MGPKSRYSLHRSKSTKISSDHKLLQHCSFVASPNALEISPPCLPLDAVVQLAGVKRCVYLTATQPSPLSMCRTFGVSDVETVRPKGKSGDAQRLFVFAPGETDVEQRRFALGMVESEKSCVIAPSKRLAEDWTPEATLFEKEDGQEEIDSFCESPDADMLGLVARYDGIDLPGNACRHLILYHLPIGESLFARFVDETLQVESIRTSRTATRLTQAVGRIFRSNTDHGVVIVVGSDLQGWLRRVANQQYLPQRLQQQLKLASDLETQIVQGETSWGELAKALTVADPGWDQTYSSHIDNYGAIEAPNPAEWSVELALKEHAAFWDLWSGQAHQASAAFSDMADQAAEHDDRLAAWYSHLSGLCSLQAGNAEEAYVSFLGAANVRAELGRPSTNAGRVFKTDASTVICHQAKALAGRYRKKRAQMLKELARVKTDIGIAGQTNRVEEAVKLLGGLLGLDASRPDKEVGKGPDTLWEGAGTPSALGIELKTDKKQDTYSKDEIGQCHNHDQFLRERFGDSFVLALAGGAMRVSPKANPSPELRVLPMTAFVDVYDRTQKLYDAVEGETGAGLDAAFDRWLRHLGLVWPALAQSLESRLAMDLMHE